MNHREVTRRYHQGAGIPWVVLEDPDGAGTDLYRSISTADELLRHARRHHRRYLVPPAPRRLRRGHPRRQLEKVRPARGGHSARPPPDSPAPRMASNAGSRREDRSPWRLSRSARRWSTCLGDVVRAVRGGDPGAPEVRREPRESGYGPTVMISVRGRGVGRAHREFSCKLNLELRHRTGPRPRPCRGAGPLVPPPRTYVVAPGGVVLSYRAEARSGTTRWSGRECSRAFAMRRAGEVKDRATLHHPRQRRAVTGRPSRRPATSFDVHGRGGSRQGAGRVARSIPAARRGRPPNAL